MDNKKKRPKREYEKPMLRIIELAAEEVMGIGCKTNPGDASGASSNGCANALCSLTPGS